MTSLLPFALDYASRYGWAVHPVNLHKKPTTEHGFYDATTDEPTIRDYFKNGAQLSIRTGAASGVFVLDIDEDPDKGYSVAQTLEMLTERYGALPHTPHQRTGRGGLQYFFKHQDGLRNKAGTLIGPGVDTRGEGGYAVVAPSRNSNGTYTWIVSPADAPLADVPAWLVDLMTAKPERKEQKHTVNLTARNLDPYLDRAFRDEVANVATAQDGTKHETLRNAAIKLGSLIAHGLNERAIQDALYNAISGRAADPDNALRTIQDGIAYGKLHPRDIPDRPQPSAAPSLSRSFILTCLGQGEAGDAQLVEKLYAGQLVYDHAGAAWYTFEQHAWIRYDGMPRRAIWGRVSAAYLGAASDLQSSLEHEADDSKRSEIQKTADLLIERAKKLRSVSRINNVLTLTQELLGIKGNEWDADPWLLGVKNGVLDLRTGQLRDGTPPDYIRTVAPTEWRGLSAPAPRWERFVSEVLSDEGDRVAFLQRLLGYALNGSTKEHVLGIFVGERGRNGKRVLFEALQHVLGDYSKSVSTDVLIGQEHMRGAGSAQPHLMELQGKRLTYCSETKEHDTLSTAQVKNITGGDPITARWLHANPVTFMPSHTLFLQTNRRPQAPADDDALWERVKVIEFKVRFVDEPSAPDERPRDLRLEATLQAESSGILAWLVRGGLDWQHGGLQTPPSVRLARDSYRAGESIEPFLVAACIEVEDQSAEGGALFAAYQSWCKAQNLKPKSTVWFGKQLAQRFEKGRTVPGRICYYGVRLETTEFEAAPVNTSSDASTTLQNPSEPIGTPNAANVDRGVYTFSEGLRSISKSSMQNSPREGIYCRNPSNPSEPSDNGESATWHAKEVDHIGRVLGYAGVGPLEGEDVPYVWFAGDDGGKTGVPLKQIEFHDPCRVTDWLEDPPRYTVTEWTDGGAVDLPGAYPTLEAARAAMPEPPYRAVQSIHKPNVNERLAREQMDAELAAIAEQYEGD